MVCPSTSLGPVQPFGGAPDDHGPGMGRLSSPVVRAWAWMRWISRMAQSRAAAMVWCICSGSLPSTKRGFPAAAPEEALQLAVGDAGEDGGVVDLKPIEVEDGEHGPVSDGV